MGWLHVAYNLTVGEIQKQATEKAKAGAVGFKVLLAAGIHRPEAITAGAMPLVEQLGALALAPEISPELPIVNEDFREAA